MAEHTPTTETVRDCFVDGAAGDFIEEDFDRWLAAHDAELRAECSLLNHENRLADAAVKIGRLKAERDEAQRQLADLRAGIEALAAELEKPSPSTLAYRSEVARAVRALAGSGEQPGVYLCANPDAPDHPPHGLPLYIESWGTCDARPAPVVPDSTDVRGELLHVLDSHGIDTYIDGTGAEVGVQNLITDILAVVGQGVAEEIERLRDALTDDPDRAALELIVEDAARIARGVGS